MQYCLVLCTCPDPAVARTLAEGLVAERRATCVNIIPGLVSVYPWEGTIETAEECLLLAKTEADAFEAVESFLKDRHPYELPEIIAVPVGGGSAAYLDWITEWLHPKS